MSRDLMIDLETLGTGPTAVILQAGWSMFNLENLGMYVANGFVNVSASSCLKAGMTWDWDTLKWWLDQELETLKTVFSGTTPLNEALDIIEGVFKDNQPDTLWSHGASFDIPILDHAFRISGRKAPWAHKIIRDTRTLFSIAPPVWPENPRKHSAMHDAIAQAGAVLSSWSQLKR